MVQFILNAKTWSSKLPPDTPLLWVIRDELGYKGTKFGCGKGLCGACTVQLNGQAVRSCSLPLKAAEGQKLTTIEGLGDTLGEQLKACWVKHSVPQCGYCQSGQLMTAHAYLKSNPKPKLEEAKNELAKNLCRCGTYPRIARALAEVLGENLG